MPPMPAAAQPASRHAAIAAQLRGEIQAGRLATGSELPSEAELSQRFAVSRGTVRQALGALRAEGLISGGRGRRPVVARSSLTQSFDQLNSFTAWASGLGRLPGARTLELARRPASERVAAALAIEAGTPVFQYKRVRLLDHQPVMIEHTTLIEPVGRLLLDCDLDHGSVYAQLAERGVLFHEAQQSISAVASSAEQSALLEVARRAPLLEVRRVAFDARGSALEYSLDTYRGDVFTITIHNQIAAVRAGVGLELSA